jgi:hypothetical protein
MYARFLYGNREISSLTADAWLRWVARIGKARRRKPMMHGREKADLARVAMKPANNAAQAAADWVRGALNNGCSYRDFLVLR